MSEPIVDEHVIFARELVALARKHGVGMLDSTFRLSGSARFFKGTDNWQQVRLTWSEGRHGDQSEITLRAEASLNVGETIEGKKP